MLQKNKTGTTMISIPLAALSDVGGGLFHIISNRKKQTKTS